MPVFTPIAGLIIDIPSKKEAHRVQRNIRCIGGIIQGGDRGARKIDENRALIVGSYGVLGIIKSGVDIDGYAIGLPYGLMAKRILIYAASHFLNTGELCIPLDRTPTDFLRKLGYGNDPPSQTIQELRKQLHILATSKVSFRSVSGVINDLIKHVKPISAERTIFHGLFHEMNILRPLFSLEDWTKKEGDIPSFLINPYLFYRTIPIELKESTFKINHKPKKAMIDLSFKYDNYVKKLKYAQLNIFMLMVDQLPILEEGIGFMYSWDYISVVIGKNYRNDKSFREKFNEDLKEVKNAYPESKSKIEADTKNITFFKALPQSNRKENLTPDIGMLFLFRSYTQDPIEAQNIEQICNPDYRKCILSSEYQSIL